MHATFWKQDSNTELALSYGEISVHRFFDIILAFRQILSKNKTFPISWKKIDFSKKFWEKTFSKKIQLIFDKLNLPSIEWNSHFDGTNFSYVNVPIPHDGNSLLWVMVRHFENISFVKLTEKERLLFVICLRVLFHIPYSWFTEQITKVQINLINKSIDFSRNMCGEGDIIYTKMYYLQIQQVFTLHIPFSYTNSSSSYTDSTPEPIQEEEHYVVSLREILSQKESKKRILSKKSVDIEMTDICSKEELHSNLEKCKETIKRLQGMINNSDDNFIIEFTRLQISHFEEEILRLSFKLSN
jgi:hypothetical protein